MRIAVTLRLDAGLLTQARRQAVTENRSLTNLIETALKERMRPDQPNEPALGSDRALSTQARAS